MFTAHLIESATNTPPRHRRQAEANRKAMTASTEGELDRSWSSESSHSHPMSGTPFWREFRERQKQRRRYRRGSSAEAPMLASEDWTSNHGSSGTGTPQSFSTAQSVLEHPRDQQDSPTPSLLVEDEAQHDDAELDQLLDALNNLTRRDKSTIFGKLEQELFHIDSDMASVRSEGSISDMPLMIRDIKTELSELSQSLKGHAENLKAEIRSDMRDDLKSSVDNLKAEIKGDFTKNLNITADRLEFRHSEGFKTLNTEIRDDMHYMKVDLEDATRDLRHLKEISRANGGDLTFLTYDIASVKNTLSAHVTAIAADIEDLKKQAAIPKNTPIPSRDQDLLPPREPPAVPPESKRAQSLDSWLKGMIPKLLEKLFLKLTSKLILRAGKGMVG